MTAIAYRSDMMEDEHRAWLDALSDDERMIAHLPIGYRFSLVLVSHIKRALAMRGTTVAERLQLLEGLSGLVDTQLSAEMVAAVQPACNTAIAMIHEAMKLPTPERLIVGRFDVFSEFARLNPSLRTAIALRYRSPPTPNSTPERASAYA